MNYKESIYKEEEQQFVASEPVMATYVSTVPKIMNAEELKAYCKEHAPSDFLRELEDNNFYLDSDIPVDAFPQSTEEWMKMAEESEASGWVTEAEFIQHTSLWSRT